MWIDQLQPASFRGVPFQVDEISHQAGDSVVVREYPFQDLPTVFSMGEGAEEIRLSAYVIGSDYIAQRDALRDVLSGDGLLVHPTAGAIWVHVAGRYVVKENPVFEGGVARFDLTFIRAETRRYPAGVENTEAQAEDAADAADAAAQADFAATFDLASAPGWVADQAGGQLMDSLASVWDSIGSALATLEPTLVFTGELFAEYQALRDGFSGLLRSPAAMARGIAGLFSVPVDLTPAQATAFQGAYRSLFVMETQVRRSDVEVVVMPPPGGGLVMYGSSNAVDAGGAERVRLRQLTAAADQLVETLAVAAYVRCTARMELEGYDEAMAMRSAVHAQCVRLLNIASSAPAPGGLPALPWHDAMAALHAAALRDLNTRTRGLGRLSSYMPGAWQPVWYVSYRLYGTAAYADEIMALNPHITHPLLVPPGKALRVVQRSD